MRDDARSPRATVGTCTSRWWLSSRISRWIKPVLATEWKRLDTLTFQFKLRQDVKLDNGEELDGEAAKLSIVRPLAPETRANACDTYAGISGVDVVDTYAVNRGWGRFVSGCRSPPCRTGFGCR